ncbi:hypothetical protein Cni_G13890 [Canna indica]|uniref:HAT C-terminal dimerisation domain-containing protein n=1 Tax=Canna indica TaxID=4628 RepID=A0AAQ3KBZ7_9LILI|nr:hypothetical protein Cni_G13890 [Canna indica]
MHHDMYLRSDAFDPLKFRELLISAIIMNDLPLPFVEYSGVRALFTYLREKVPIICRNTARADILKLYKREKSRMKCLLEETSGRICLTSDLWTSIATDGYLSLTTHFINKNWVLQKRILNFILMPPPHSGIELNNKINSLLIEWAIERKLFSVTLYNASANDTCVSLLRSHLSMKNAFPAKDPRYKLQFVGWSYKKLYGSHSHEFETVRIFFFSLHEEYASSRECGSSMLSPTKGQSGSHCDKKIQEEDMLEEFDVYEGDEYSMASRKSELEKYLDETRIDRKTELDILSYWKINGQRYPTVARMARDIISISL